MYETPRRIEQPIKRKVFDRLQRPVVIGTSVGLMESAFGMKIAGSGDLGILGHEYPHEGSRLERRTWFAINEILGKYESFAPESAVTRHVQDRLNIITEGEKAKVIVVHHDEPNASALPGYIVVTDGMLKLIEYQEELDGLLAHEWNHINRGHHEDHHKDMYSLDEIGRKRVHETEADIASLELLDRRGINPLGLITLFEKMEAYDNEQKRKIREKQQDSFGEYKSKPRFEIGDIIHGSFQDRRLNIEELLWLLDVRNLSNKFTSFVLEPQEFDTYQKDSEVWENYNRLDPLAKGHFIRRQFHKLTSDEENDVELSNNKLVSLQRQLLREIDPGRTDDEIDKLTAISIVGMLPVTVGVIELKGIFEKKFPNGMSIEDLIQTPQRYDEIIHLYQLFYDQSLKELGIALDATGNKTIIREGITRLILSQPGIDMDQYRQMYDATKDGVIEDAIAEPLFAYLKKRNAYTSEEGAEINSFLADLTIDIAEMSTKIGEQAERVAEANEKYDAERIMRDVEEYGRMISLPPEEQAFLDTIEAKRIEKAMAIKDPIAFFQHVSTYSYRRHLDFDEVWRSWKITVSDKFFVAPVSEKADAFVHQISIAQMVNMLKKYAGSHDLTNNDKQWLFSLTHQYQGEYAGRKRNVYRMGVRGYTEVDVNVGKPQDRFLLWAMGMDKTEYLSQVEHDIAVLFGSRYKNLESLDALMQMVIAMPQRAKELGLPVDWEVTETDIAGLEAVSKLLLKNAMQAPKEEDKPSALFKLLGKFSIGNIASSRFKEEELEDEDGAEFKDFEVLSAKWEKTIKGLLRKKSFTDQDLLELFALSTVADNYQIILQVPPAAMKELATRMSFEGAVDLILERFAHLPQYIFAQAIEYLVEYKAHTPEDLDQLEAILRGKLDRFMQQDALVGKVALADGLLVQNYVSFESKERRSGVKRDEIKGLEPVRLLNAMLTTSISDEELKRYLLERWWVRYRTDVDLSEDIRNQFDIEDLITYRYPGKEKRYQWWANSQPFTKEGYKTLPQLLSDAYLASMSMKYYALRKILTGEHGVLADPETRMEVIDGFLNGWVDFGDSGDSESVMRKLLTSFFTVANKDELYQRINPVLLDMILKIPEHTFSYEQLASEFADKQLERMLEDGHIKSITDLDRRYLSKKINNLMTGWQQVEQTLDTSNVITRLLARFSDVDKPADERRLSPIELAVLVGRKAGAVGVRALQLAGQYFPLPKEELDNFSQVYDGIRGQTRLQAYRTLKREAQFSPQIAELLDDIIEIQPRVGGGSLMTVYRVLLKDGSVEAIAVKNPNVEYHVDKIIDTLKKTIAHVRQQDPDNKDYQLFEVLLSDVEEWVYNELEDPKFEEKDIRFRKQNDSSHGLFDTGNNKYGIVVPHSTPTGTRWVRREEFIEGKNFTGLKMTEGESNISAGIINEGDYRQAVSLIVRNYLYQLTETGLVHSDIHPGNFRITADNKNIAIFDRYNLLELNEHEKEFIKNLVIGVAVGGVEGALGQTVNFLFEDEKNQHLHHMKDELVAQALGDTSDDLEQGIMNAVIKLKQRGVYVPLKISLIAKNLFALNTLAKGAGFQGIVDAFNATV